MLLLLNHADFLDESSHTFCTLDAYFLIRLWASLISSDILKWDIWIGDTGIKYLHANHTPMLNTQYKASMKQNNFGTQKHKFFSFSVFLVFPSIYSIYLYIGHVNTSKTCSKKSDKPQPIAMLLLICVMHNFKI